MLPKFSGDERTAYLKYPICRKKWVSHIMDYEDKYWSTLLLSHLDSKALERIIGLEKTMIEPWQHWRNIIVIILKL